MGAPDTQWVGLSDPAPSALVNFRIAGESQGGLRRRPSRDAENTIEAAGSGCCLRSMFSLCLSTRRRLLLTHSHSESLRSPRSQSSQQWTEGRALQLLGGRTPCG